MYITIESEVSSHSLKCISIRLLLTHSVAWYLYYMVAQNTVHAIGVNQVFRFVEGIEGYIERVVKSGKDLFYFIPAQHVISYHLI